LLGELIERSLLALRAAAGPGPLAVFVDPTLSAPAELHEDWQRTLQDTEAAGATQWVQLGHIHDNFDPHRHPGFFYLENEQATERLLALTIQIAAREALNDYGPEHHARCLCGWILNAPPAQVLKQVFTQLARVHKPNGATWYLRYWDPRVTWHLPRVLTSVQLQLAHQAMGHWWAISPMNQLVCTSQSHTRAKSKASAVEAVNGQTLPLHFDSKGWALLERLGVVNTVLRLAWEWDVLPTESAAQRVDELVQRCHARGFYSDQDALIFSACGLTSHARFDEHPAVDKALRQAGQDGQSLQAALSRFEETFWSDLAAERWLAAPTKDG
jgi:hypothetical protein